MSRAVTLPEQTEHELMRVIRQYVETRLGIKLYRVTPGFRGGYRVATSGLPDLFGCMPPNGRWIAVEVKKPKARPRPNEAAQNSVLDDLRRAGALVIVCRSVDEVAKALENHGGRT